ncbi:MAG: hypothetical protein RLZZ519_3471 [Bacteroidota bacterium]
MKLGFFLFLVVCCTDVPLGASCVNTHILASFSEQIGEVASMAAIEGMIPGAEQLPSALPGDGKQGQFDWSTVVPMERFTSLNPKVAARNWGRSRGRMTRAILLICSRALANTLEQLWRI